MTSRTTQRNLFRTLLFIFSLLFAANVHAQQCHMESEPNDTPAEANPLSGDICVTGTLGSNDQDMFIWTVSELGSQQRWSFELESIPGQLTNLQVFRVEFAENGVDVVEADAIYTVGSRNGSPVESTPRLFSTGTYFLGISASGGEGSYTFAILPERPSWYFDDYDYERQVIEQYDEFDFAGWIQGTQNFSWTISEELANNLWSVEVEAAVDESVSLEVIDPSGELLTTLQTGETGTAKLFSLGVEEGTYSLNAWSSSARVGPFRLLTTPQGQVTSGQEIEPNDRFGDGNELIPGAELHGVLSGTSDWDYFRFSIDEGHAARLFDLETGAAENIEMCLLNGDGRDIQCRTKEGASLPSLHLPEGHYGIMLRSRSNVEDVAYTLLLRDVGEVPADMPVEPNDTADWAFPLPDDLSVRGELYGTETDFFRVEITGEPQLWRVQALGSGLQELGHHTLGGRSTAQDRGSERLRLDNLYLLPGTHFFSVRGTDGAYSMRLLPLGPPAEGAVVIPVGEEVDSTSDEDLAFLPTLPRPAGRMELEPNDDPSRAEQLTFTEPRVGLLASDDDTDVYRFFIPNDQHVLLQVIPPAEAEYRATMSWGSTEVFRVEHEGGEVITIDEWLPAGDYHLRLRANTPSNEYYQVTLERLDPFIAPADDRSDYPKWYERGEEMPALAEDAGVTLELAAADTEAVAAFWPLAQRIDLVLSVVNTTSEQLELELDWHSTAAGWHLELPHTLALGAEGQEQLRVSLHVAADAPDESAVITVRARAAEGQQQTTMLTFTPDSFAEPVNDFFAWSVPSELLGGLNAAWSALGAEIYSATENDETLADRFSLYRLFDGMTPLDHQFFAYNLRDRIPYGLGVEEYLPTVRLAGEEPVEVAGFLLNPLATENTAQALRDFAVYLSLDGEEFDKVFEGSLAAAQIEQGFALPEPVLARYARLEMLSNHIPDLTPLETTIYVGTFKVVTTADSAAEVAGAAGLNLADPAVGGHIVWSSPPEIAHSYKMLLEDGDSPNGRLADDQDDSEWVIAFLNNRAAQISEIQWFDHPDSQVGGYYDIFETVEISVSTDSPAGPWAVVGVWNLDRSGGGVTPYVFDDPVWARYVRFRATGLEPRARYDYPELIRILERVPDAEYSSALGEWGHYRSVGPFEFAEVGASLEAETVQGNTTRDAAAALEPGDLKQGTVLLGASEAWYRIDVPAELNELLLTLAGTPTREFAYELTNNAGEPVPVAEDASPAEVTVRAKVEPGTYWLRLYEPPRSVVITWDTSGSVAAARPVIYQALASFASSISPGVEEVNLLPFDSPFLLRTWSGDPLRVLQAINDDPRDTSSSSGEAALLKASEALADQPGKKAVILLTDAAVPRDTGLWKVLLEVQPQVFASEITAAGDLVPRPRNEQQLMQDYASVNGGFYEYVLSQGDFDVSFRRAAAWLRRPSHYTVSVELLQTWEKASAWAENELQQARELGIIPEVLAGADLTAPITRAEFAAVAVRVYEALTGVDAVPVAVNPFVDTDDPEVLKAFNTELAVGISATEFAPDALLNREQAATILTRVFKKVNLPGWTWADDANFALDFDEPEAFVDDEFISGWARESVYFMAANGIITGTGGGKFTPRAVTSEQVAMGYANATREQALLLAVRLVQSR